jgi:hypothetical protein
MVGRAKPFAIKDLACPSEVQGESGAVPVAASPEFRPPNSIGMAQVPGVLTMVAGHPIKHGR